MNEKLKELIKKIFIGAAASISTATISANPKANEFKINDPALRTEITYNFKKEDEHPKLILKKPARLNLISNLFHRSHSSHSSHRSHTSHTSHYSSYTTPKEEPRVEKEKRLTSEKNENTSTNKNQLIYELGSRILERGMKGTDVAELQDILLKKGYKVKVDGEYNKITEDAVKLFQKDKKIEVTGKADVTTLYYIKKNK